MEAKSFSVLLEECVQPPMKKEDETVVVRARLFSVLHPSEKNKLYICVIATVERTKRAETRIGFSPAITSWNHEDEVDQTNHSEAGGGAGAGREWEHLEISRFYE